MSTNLLGMCFQKKLVKDGGSRVEKVRKQRKNAISGQLSQRTTPALSFRETLGCKLHLKFSLTQGKETVFSNSLTQQSLAKDHLGPEREGERGGKEG